MKKKILKNSCIGLGILVVSALLSVGILYMLINRNVAKTGNVLGVSWYNETDKEFTISTSDELYEFARLSTYYDFKGQTVKLGADIVINEGNAEDWAEKAPARRWTSINGFMGTFDGQGHTISGLYAKGYNAAIAMFSNTKGECQIQNFKFVNSYLEGRGFGGVASIVSNGGGNLKQIYSNAIINVNGEYCGYAAGICSKVNLKTNIEECWYDGVITTSGRDAGGIVDNVIASTVSISHCLFSGEIHGTWNYSGTRIGGIVGRTITEGANLTLDDCLSSGKITAEHISYTGAVLGTSMAGTSLKTKNTYATRGKYAPIGSSGSNGNIYSMPLEISAENLMGYQAYQWTNLDFENYWAVVEEETPVLQCFADTVPSLNGIEKAYDISWYNETSGGIITTQEQLYGFYILSGNTDFAGKTVKLGADIALNEGKSSDWSKTAPANIWSPINGFSGTFDGQGHTISGMYINTATRYVGFFGMTNKTCVVKDFNLRNSIVINHGEGTTPISTGSVAGVAHGKFTNIYSDAIMDTSGIYIGGLFGQVYQNTTISDCWYDGKITHAGRYAGGVVGLVSNATVNVEHCLNTGEIEVIWSGGFCNSGGIVGATLSGNNIKLAVTDCLNIGTIKSTMGGLGSLIGQCVKGVTTITDCYVLKGSNAKDGKSLGHKQSTVMGGAVTLDKELLTGYSAYDWSTLDFENHWSIVLNGTPVLKNFASSSPSVAGRAKAFDISWYDAKADASVIKSVKQLYGFFILSGRTNFKNKTIKLGANITLNSGDASTWSEDNTPVNKWYPINGFTGTFDGQGHTISGMYINSNSRYLGFFGLTGNTAVVKNFSLKNSKIINKMGGKALLSTGSIAGSGHGTFDTIYSNAILDVSGDGAGGMFGQLYNNTTIRNCQYDGVLTNEGRYSGGIVGCVTKNTVNIEDCLNTGTINVTRESGFVNSAGILGATYNNDAIVVTIKDCFNSGDIVTNQGGTGSVLGQCVVGTVNISNTYATAESNTRNRNGIGYINKGTVNGNIIQFPEFMMLGTDGYRTTYLDFTNYWAAIDKKTPQLQSFAGKGLTVGGDKLFDTGWYKESGSEFTLTTAKQLYGFTVLSANTDFAGKIIKLGENIILNDADADTFGATPPKNAWVPINKFAGTFDGQGKSIKGLYVASGSKVGLFSETTKTAVVKNLKLEEAYVIGSSSEGTGSIVGRGGGTFTAIYSDAIVKGAVDKNSIGGIVGYVNKNATFESIQFAGHVLAAKNQVGGITGVVESANVSMKNCHVSGTVETTVQSGHMNLGMMVGRVFGTSDVYMETCLLTGYLKHNHPGANSNANRMYANIFVGKMEGKEAWLDIQKSVYISNAGHWPQYKQLTQGSNAGTIWKKANTVKSVDKADMKGHLAMYNADVSALGLCDNAADTSKAWAAIEGNTPQLRIFAKGTIVDLTQYVIADDTWYTSGRYAGTDEDPYIIKNAGELLGLSNLVHSGITFKDKYIALGADIVYNQEAPNTVEGWKNYTAKNQFTPIGTPDKEFQGTFDGRGKIISGIYVSSTSDNVGLFGALGTNALVENLKLLSSYISGGNQVGSIAGNSFGNLTNVESNAVVCGSGNVGGLIGLVDSAPEEIEITKCSHNGEVVTTNANAGGILAHIKTATVTLSGCSSSSKIKSTGGTKDNYASNVGGMVAHVEASGVLNVEKSIFTGILTGNGTTAGKHLGGIVGYVNGSTVDIDKTYVSGSIEAVQMAGGLVGGIYSWSTADSLLTMTDCHVNGTIKTSASGHQNAGGLVGYADGNKTSPTLNIQATRCLVTGKIACVDGKDYGCMLVGKVEDYANFSCLGSVYYVNDEGYHTATKADGEYLTHKAYASGKGKKGTIDVRLAEGLLESQLTGNAAITNAPGLAIDGTGSTWVATKTGFPTLRIFANANDIYVSE